MLGAVRFPAWLERSETEPGDYIGKFSVPPPATTPNSRADWLEKNVYQ